MGKPGRPRRVVCRNCGRHTDDCGGLSARGLCYDCGIGKSSQQQAQLAAKTGPFYEEWRRKTLISMGLLEPDSGGDG